ncbi:MAG TPA: ATP-binding protein [Thermoleophilaceae bacterium]|jgi:two-component system sensor histidine kinase KdpD|nr:ATP-binding protein [Thermoleophilaceae bacterium]
MVWHARLKDSFAAVAEGAAAVAVATGAVALLDSVAPATSLGVVYVLAVMFVAVRRGEVPALVTAAASVLALNFFFIEPRHRLTIADSHNVIALAVLLVSGFVVARLAAMARARAAEASLRAEQALSREREAKLLAEAASSLLGASDGRKPVVGPSLQRALEEAGARLELCHAPAPKSGEVALPLRMSGSSGWLYVEREGQWSRADADRVIRAFSNLIALAQERTRIADTAAETEATRRADVAKTAIMHAISHDLRTPLTAISTAAGALHEPGLSEDDRTELASVVSTETDRLERMVTDLLDLSRIEAGAVNPQTDWCDLYDTIARAAEHVRGQRGDFALKVDVSADLPLVRADAAQLERVFTNLIDNAAKFSPSGKPVEIRGIAANGRVTIRVIDHGRGIPAAEHAHIFKPFVRGRDAQPGSGLGLAICRGFVEANGGRITLQSRGREGSAFAVSFPAVAQPELVG